MDEDIELLTENIDILKDEIYSDEKMIESIENIVKHFKKNYNLLLNKNEIKMTALIKRLKKFLIKASISTLGIILFCLITTSNIMLFAIINILIFLIMDTKNWLKDTEEIRFLEKNTSLEKILINIQNEEKDLYELRYKLNLNKKKLKEFDDKFHLIKNNQLVIEDDFKNTQTLDRPLQLNRLKRIS